MDLHQYATLAEKMRAAQKKFFAIARNYNSKPSEKTAALEESKKLEKEFDEATKSILHIPAATQQGLF